jgi:DNA replication protein DnaC
LTGRYAHHDARLGDLQAGTAQQPEAAAVVARETFAIHDQGTGATGSGKTWLACALAQQCCRQGASVQYWRVPRLVEELRIAHGDGSYIKFLKSTAKSSLIVLDDWGLTALSNQDRADLLEILDDRITTGTTLIASQLPVDTWHAYLGEPTLADAILDRLIHQSHRIELKIPGRSMRDEAQKTK